MHVWLTSSIMFGSHMDSPQILHASKGSRSLLAKRQKPSGELKSQEGPLDCRQSGWFQLSRPFCRTSNSVTPTETNVNRC